MQVDTYQYRLVLFFWGLHILLFALLAGLSIGHFDSIFRTYATNEVMVRGWACNVNKTGGP